MFQIKTSLAGAKSASDKVLRCTAIQLNSVSKRPLNIPNTRRIVRNPQQASAQVQIRSYVHTHINEKCASVHKTKGSQSHTRAFQTSQNQHNKITDKLGEAGRKLIGILFPPPPRSVPSRMVRRSAERIAHREKAPRTDKAYMDYQKLKGGDIHAQTPTQSQKHTQNDTTTHYSKPKKGYSREMQAYESGIVRRSENRLRSTGRYVARQPLMKFAKDFDGVRRNYLEIQIEAVSTSRVCLDHFADNWNEYYGENVASILGKCAQEYIDAEHAEVTPMIARPFSPTAPSTGSKASSTERGMKNSSESADIQVRPKDPTPQELKLEALQKHKAWPILLKRTSQKLTDCSDNAFQTIVQSLHVLTPTPNKEIWTAIMRRIDMGSNAEFSELPAVLYQILASSSEDLRRVDEVSSYAKQPLQTMTQDMASVDIDILCRCIWMLNDQKVNGGELYTAFIEHIKKLSTHDASLTCLSADSAWQLAAIANDRNYKKLGDYFIDNITRTGQTHLQVLPGSGIIALAKFIHDKGRISHEAQAGTSAKAQRLGSDALNKASSAFVVDAISECVRRGAQDISGVDLKTTLSVLRLAPYCTTVIDTMSLEKLTSTLQRDLAQCSSLELVEIVNSYVNIEQTFNRSAACVQLYQKVGLEVLGRIKGRGASEDTFGTTGRSVNDIAVRDVSAAIHSDLSMLVGVLHAFARAGYVESSIFPQSIPILRKSLDRMEPETALRALYAFATARSLTPELAKALVNLFPIDFLKPVPPTTGSVGTSTGVPASGSRRQRKTWTERPVTSSTYEALFDATWGLSITSRCLEHPELVSWTTNCLAALDAIPVGGQARRVPASVYHRAQQAFRALELSNVIDTPRSSSATSGSRSPLREFAELRAIEYAKYQGRRKQSIIEDVSEALQNLGVKHHVSVSAPPATPGFKRNGDGKLALGPTERSTLVTKGKETIPDSDASKKLPNMELGIDCWIPSKRIAIQVITDSECVLAETGHGDEGVDTRGLDAAGIRVLSLETEVSLQMMEELGWTVLPLFTSDWRDLQSREEKAMLIAHLLGEDGNGDVGLA